MAFETGLATDYKNLLSKFRDFAKRANSVTAAVADPGNTGNGTCSQPTADDNAPTELWTLTATGATTFTVVGAVSGPQSNATVGVAYDDIVQFTITAGGTAFVSGDKFTFTVTQELGVNRWTENDYSTGANDELYLQGPGITSSDEIFVAIRTEYDDPTPYYCWVLQGHTAYSVSETFHNQLGAIEDTRTPLVLLDNQSIEYWFVGNGNRLAGVVRVGSVYEPFYLGFPLIYGYPNTYPYPLCIGGASAYTATAAYRKFSDVVGNFHRGYMDGYKPSGADYSSVGSLMVLSGAWASFGNYYGDSYSNVVFDNNIWPYLYGVNGSLIYNGVPNQYFEQGDPLLDGTWAPFPCVLVQKTPSYNMIGELDGIFAVHGIGMQSEDELTIGGKVYKVFQNTYHTEAENFFAMLLE
jgi:hypothetical protein